MHLNENNRLIRPNNKSKSVKVLSSIQRKIYGKVYEDNFIF